jgi:hypothetical protein
MSHEPTGDLAPLFGLFHSPKTMITIPDGTIKKNNHPVSPMTKLILSFLTTGLLASMAGAATINFDDAEAGKPPIGWTSGVTGKGEAKWTVEKDDSAPSKPNVLKQSAEGTYPICIKDDASLKDGFVEVKFKPIAGKKDQAGGVIWRVQDKDNYYIARANALEDNVTIFHTIKGKRVDFKNVDTKVAPNQWHTLHVDFHGNQFAVTLDGHKVIEATDDSFSDAGKVGLWTKADSVTLFDDFMYAEQ